MVKNKCIERMQMEITPKTLFRIRDSTEADYDGGMILEPSLDESPRGLKRLLSQMNSGQRI